MAFAHVFEHVLYPGSMNGQPRKFYHAPLIMLAGLCAAQIIGTLQVYQSNARLLQTITTVKNAGYLAIPNDLVAPLLKTVKTACMGGLFFTLSIGAGITLLALLSTWTWKYVCLRKPYLAIPLLLPWLAFIILLNLRGPAILPSLYFTAVPMLVSVLTLKLMPDTLGRSGWIWSCVHPVILLLLAVFWMTQYSPDMFGNIRDRLLLTHPPGIAFNNFYYRYTLYPAEVFKSLDQKMIKTCRVDGTLDHSSRKQVLAHLADRNYLVVQDAQKVDLELKINGGNVELANQSKIFVRTSLKNFMENPGQVLTSFSKNSDCCLFFRQATFVSLLVAFPIVLYVYVNTLFFWLASFYFRPGNAAVLAGLLCLLAGCLMILPVRSGTQSLRTPDRIPKLLQSEKWQDNVDALKAIVREDSRFPLNADASGLATSPRIPVRYWLARSLARSTGSRTYAVLMRLMDDPQPIVVCQALYSLGRRNEAQSIGNVLHKINQTDHWYVQWYAYNALKDLGWRQKSSI
jgi:hypothetical protein